MSLYWCHILDLRTIEMGKRSVITSEEILEQAYQLACEQGLRSLSIRSIATACDVSVGTVYNSYASKTELINDVVGMFWQRAFAETMKTLAVHEGNDFARRFRRALRVRSKNSGRISSPIFLRSAKVIVSRRRSENSKVSSTRVQESNGRCLAIQRSSRIG